MRLSVIGSLVLLTVLPLAQGRAQTEVRSPRFGVTGGMNLAKLSGDGRAQNRTGFLAGGLVVLPVARNLSFQPEILFATKGVAASDSGIIGSMKLQYIEVPVVLRLDIPTSSKGIKPFAYAGPAISLKTGCAIEGSVGGISGSVDCDVISGPDPGDVNFHSGDVGGLVGGGLAFDVGGRLLTVGARYEVGFVSIFSNDDAKNRVLSFLGTFEWPFHARK
ncbi:MAG TPA: porin family protein [Gemmatimonadaceae bacterium]